MPADVTREEFEARVGVVEREKMVTRHILEQTRRNADDLAGIKTRLDRVERKVDGVAQEVDGLKTTIGNLVQDLPKIIGAAVRDVLPKRRPKS